MAATERSTRAATSHPSRIRWQFDADVPASDFFEDVDLTTDFGLNEAVDDFLFWMKQRRFHSWEGVICQEQGIPPTAEQQQAADDLICFGPADEDPPVESRVLYINEIPRPTEPWYEILRKIVDRLLLDPFDVTAANWEVHCHGWSEIEECLGENAAGLSLPEGVLSPLDVIPAELRHRLRLQNCFFALRESGYEGLAVDDADSCISWFIDDLRKSREAVEQLELTLDSLLTMVKLPEVEQPHFVRAMKQRLGIESNDEPLASRLFSDSSERYSGTPTGTTTGEAQVDKGRAGDLAAHAPSRLSTESIERAILHPEPGIREMAVRYFARAYAGGVAIMPLVIEALEKYGKECVYMIVGAASKLQQTADTIDWVIHELNDERSGSYESYTHNLERILVSADPQLLRPRLEDIFSAQFLTARAREIIEQRIEMAPWDASRCWRELEKHCELHQSAEYACDADLARAERIVEALARHEVAEQRVLDLLSQQVDPSVDSPMKWMEPLAVQLAGRLRLETAIPLLIDKMQLNDDLLLEKCEVALIRIGGDAVVRAIAGALEGAEFHFRNTAISVLESIHSDLAVKSLLQLLTSEVDTCLGCRLRLALLDQFSFAAIEPARQWLLERGFADVDDRSLRNQLLQTCEVLGKSFPEYEQWKGDEKAEELEWIRVMEEAQDNPLAPVIYALNQLGGTKASNVLEEDEWLDEDEGLDEDEWLDEGLDEDEWLDEDGWLKENEDRDIDSTIPAIGREPHQPPRIHVGRNDPCPCGSGRKFKKCCLRMQK